MTRYAGRGLERKDLVGPAAVTSDAVNNADEDIGCAMVRHMSSACLDSAHLMR